MYRTLTTFTKCILLTLISLYAHATTYYIAASGNTTNNGTSTSTPWSLDKLNASWTSILAGDQILFQRGDNFNGGIVIGKSGTSTAKIIIGAYGSATAKPVLNALVPVTGWVSKGNGIYESTTTTPVDLMMVLINNKIYGQGRTPNAGSYYTSSTGGSATTVTSNMPTTVNWTGATLGARVSHWQIGRYQITAQSGSTLTIANGKQVVSGYGLWIMNDIRTLDQFGEWYRNPSTGKLSMFFGTATPSSYKVEMSTLNNIISSTSKSYITIQDIALRGSNNNAVDINYGSDITLSRCDIDASGGSGVDTKDHTNVLIDASRVTRSLNNGLHLNMYSTGDNIKATNNYIDSSYFIEGMGGGGQQDGNGITLGRGGLIQGNVIKHSGYCGLRFQAFLCTMKNNYIDTFCFIKDDGGGIYTGGNNPFTATPKKSIIGNMLFHGIGAPKGTPDVDNRGEGIYMDDDANNIDILGNTVAYVSKGLFIHNNSTVQIHDNTFYSNLQNMYYKDDNLGEIHITGINATRNISFGLTTSNRVVYAANTTSTVSAGTMGILDSNYYCRPIDETLTGKPLTWRESTEVNVNLAGWKTKYPNYDKATKATPKSITSSSEVLFLYNPTASWITSSLNGKTYIDPTGIAYTTGSITLGAYQSKILIITPSVPLAGGNITPSVSISNPSKDTSILAGSTLTLTANASDPDNGIQKVDFYSGSTLLGTDNAAPYTYTWTPIAGSYNITAKATDNSTATNNTATSATVNVSVTTKPTNPIVAITSPVNNSTYTAPATITLTANATASTGSTITRVDFYSGTTLLHTETIAPYTWSWANVVSGNYQITAVATDNNGLQTTSASVSTAVVPAVDHPSVVSITSPANGATYTAPASLTISASATDAEGVKSVAFYSGSTLLGTDNTSPYTYSWSSVGAGNYNLSVKVTDSVGNTTSSSAVAISVTDPVVLNKPPTVSLTSPTTTTYTAPATVVISANAADADGTITKVNFYAGPTLLYSDITAPYTYTWSNVVAGGYSITAVATDNSGANTTSGAISITVASTPPPTNVPPTVVIDTPFNNSIYVAPANIPLYATAADVDGTVDSVSFYNGNTLIFTERIAPWQRTWKSVPAGIYNLTAKAYDNSGAVTTSTPVKVTVSTALKAPKVALTSPVNNSSYTAPADIVIAATASDSDGTISKVDFYNGTTLLFSDLTSPYTYTWPKVAAGTYSLTAKATDNSNLSTTSGSISVTVKAPVNKIPTISLTSPASNTTFQSPTNVVIAATATDSDGTVSRVDFYEGATLLGTDVTAPYSYTWNSTPAGTFTVTAIATDNAGAQATSASRTFTVVPVNLPPTVAITTPLNNTVVTANGTAYITIKVAANDSDGLVDTVKVFANNTLLYTGIDTPFTVLSPFAAGTYTLTATARDDKGAITTSSPVSLIVKSAVAPNVSVAATATALTSPATISGSATASDPDGTVTKVEFYLNNTLVVTDLTSPYTFSIANQPAGTYLLTAKATDNTNLSTTSSPVTITVTNPMVPPTVSITSPPANAIYTDPIEISLSANAADADGTIKSVSFYQGTTLLGTDTTAPYSLVWSSVMAGSYSITAKATDNDGLVTTSSPVAITVNHINKAPTVYFISPAQGEEAPNKGGFVLNAGATDSDGTIVKVQFYMNGKLLATTTAVPYTVSVSGLNAGSYTFTAIATDNGGLTATAEVTTKVVLKKYLTVYGMQATIVP